MTTTVIRFPNSLSLRFQWFLSSSHAIYPILAFFPLLFCPFFHLSLFSIIHFPYTRVSLAASLPDSSHSSLPSHYSLESLVLKSSAESHTDPCAFRREIFSSPSFLTPFRDHIHSRSSTCMSMSVCVCTAEKNCTRVKHQWAKWRMGQDCEKRKRAGSKDIED